MSSGKIQAMQDISAKVDNGRVKSRVESRVKSRVEIKGNLEVKIKESQIT